MLANIVAIYAIGGCTYPPIKVEINSRHKDVWHRVEKVSHAKSSPNYVLPIYDASNFRAIIYIPHPLGIDSDLPTQRMI